MPFEDKLKAKPEGRSVLRSYSRAAEFCERLRILDGDAT
jgi:hypothetical protein